MNDSSEVEVLVAAGKAANLYPDSLFIEESGEIPCLSRIGGFGWGMIRGGFLSAEDRRYLMALARDGSAASRSSSSQSVPCFCVSPEGCAPKPQSPVPCFSAENREIFKENRETIENGRQSA
jgi:hypothetical protein